MGLPFGISARRLKGSKCFLHARSYVQTGVGRSVFSFPKHATSTSCAREKRAHLLVLTESWELHGPSFWYILEAIAWESAMPSSREVLRAGVGRSVFLSKHAIGTGIPSGMRTRHA